MHCKWLTVLFIFAPFSGADGQSLTKEELETLPATNLAPRLLGEVGQIIIGVERSNFPYDIKLFSRAYAPPTQYGLCVSDWITVNLDSESAKIWSVSAGPKFGVVDSIYQYPSEDREKANEKLCSELKDISNFFPAPDWITAQRVVSYIDYLKGAGPFAGRKYSFECTGSCHGIDGLAYLRTIELKNITSVSQIDCPEPPRRSYCYRIDLTGSPSGLFPRELRIYGRDNREAAEVWRAALWIGQTFF